MTMNIVLLSVVLYFFLFGGKHSLLVLMMLEGLVLMGLFFFVSFYFSWVFLLIFLLFCVCVGAYGVSLLISSSREKGGIYFLFF